MEEPSVLDYVKAKLTFWKPSTIEIPRPKEEAAPGQPQFDAEDAFLPGGEGAQAPEQAFTGEAAAAPLAAQEAGVQARSVPAARLSGQALLMALSSLGVALLAQSLLEPPNRLAVGAGALYAISAVLLGLAYFRDLVFPSPIPDEETTLPRWRFRWEGLGVGLVLMVFAFVAFSKGMAKPADDEVAYFNFLNTALWVLSIGYLIWGLYVPREEQGRPVLRDLVRRFFAAPGWKIQVTRFGLLLFAVTALVLFFRFYRLDSVPAEMVSDHAEKLWDVQDVLNGRLRVFFPRNTGREAFQFYWTALMVKLFNTGISFMALKLGTVLGGLLTLFYMYRTGKLIGNRWVALYALLFCGFSYWGNIQSRIGLRFPLYPMFLAPTLFYLLRGLLEKRRNDFIWAGLWLGAGLHGYTSFRIVPFVVVAAIIIYLLHQRGAAERKYALWGLVIVALFSLAVFLPLARVATESWDLVVSRAMTRMGEAERPLPGHPLAIFISNLWTALVMFFWDDGDVWVHSITHRPALDVISAALFFYGLVLVVLRYARRRTWVDLFLLVSIPLLLLPSVMALAFPNENPNLNRTAGAYIPAFLILAIGLDALLRAVKRNLPARAGRAAAGALALILVALSASANYDLLFNQYDLSMRQSAWNTSEMGRVVHDFTELTGVERGGTWVVAFPYWVDTRLVAINAGQPDRDMGISPEQLSDTADSPNAKLFLLNPQDEPAITMLENLYPEGRYWLYPSHTQGKDFIIFLVPPKNDLLETRN